MTERRELTKEELLAKIALTRMLTRKEAIKIVEEILSREDEPYDMTISVDEDPPYFKRSITLTLNT
jgi:hypothetical protein